MAFINLKPKLADVDIDMICRTGLSRVPPRPPDAPRNMPATFDSIHKVAKGKGIGVEY